LKFVNYSWITSALKDRKRWSSIFHPLFRMVAFIIFATFALYLAVLF